MKRKENIKNSVNLLDILNKFKDLNSSVVETVSILNNFNEQINSVKAAPQHLLINNRHPEWRERIISKLELMINENIDDLRNFIFQEYVEECQLLIGLYYEVIENGENLLSITNTFKDDVIELGSILVEYKNHYKNVLEKSLSDYPLKTYPMFEDSKHNSDIFRRVSNDLKMFGDKI
uniref:DUF2383 domain-containing protein n=1 Tax=Parastrongyloides trichosuri TaxID=131310 RepID=A0A0N4Z5U9_PARTI